MSRAKAARITLWLAVTGFTVPLVLLGLFAIGYQVGVVLSPAVLIFVCPLSILMIALDSASKTMQILAWMFILTVNAGLYAVPGLLVLAVGSWRNRS